jgi:broad specificity polyphosphatase/5'/3'-nucleotidase SurE
MVTTDTDPSTDQIAVKENYISISPIRYDLTDEAMVEAMKEWGVGDLK